MIDPIIQIGIQDNKIVLNTSNNDALMLLDLLNKAAQTIITATIQQSNKSNLIVPTPDQIITGEGK